jgi:hypothetical protein
MSALDHWNERLIKGTVSRREFIGRAAALGASSVAISQMLASAAAETPKKGGLLRLGLARATRPRADVDTATMSRKRFCRVARRTLGPSSASLPWRSNVE